MFEFILIESISIIHTIFIKIKRKLKKINFSLLHDIFLFFFFCILANVYLVFFLLYLFLFYLKSNLKSKTKARRLNNEKKIGMNVNYLIGQILIKFN